MSKYPKAQVQERRRRRPRPLKILVYVALAFTVVIVAGAIGMRDDFPKDWRTEAFDACKPFVTARLLSPASAVWPDPLDGQATYAGNVPDPITVSSYVDSKSAFGVLLRSTYTCTVAHVGDSWNLVGLDVQGGGA